ncbi:MAG: hypothetical protein PVG14_16785 [Anaerolineales bacterium]|jgi:hypothetical protein
MSTKTSGLTLIVIGVVVFLLFLLADYIGVGRDVNTFGWIQWLGVVTGFVVTAVGFYLRSRPS